MNKSTGIISAGKVWVDPEITRYYLTLFPKYWTIQPQRYKPHITFIRFKYEWFWGDSFEIYDGELIKFEYSHGVYYERPYYFLNVFSQDLDKIRLDLGLTPRRLFENQQIYHITIGNNKKKRF